MSETMAAQDDATGEAGDLRWERSYDRASIERFLAEAAAERDELRSQLTAARDRGERARRALEQRSAARSAELARMVAEAHRQIAALEDEHEAMVEAARKAARNEIDQLRAGAPDGGDGT